ncbi:serine hydrolase domain-containing protein [Paenibacillus azoreducens]|uniref:Beta-lactamase-related domain-containing protein n=1 Tax=Paenibacillus azoreducens TaxID=116718 RepID=A0A919YCF3_9BACL|nr:serine hydrolase domain-containing protein [Paenibacillus azoreducens]GIO46245.1 hypothetical protein J34TS1_10100 [Paenibacillus azoreducens]
MVRRRRGRNIFFILILCIGGAAAGILIKQSFWNAKSAQEKLDIIFNKTVDHKKVFDMTVLIESEGGKFSYRNSAGNMDENSPFAIASITKMFTAAVIFNLADSRQLSLDDPIDRFFGSGEIEHLHVYKGHDYTHAITVGQLLSQTSGLPDYYTETIGKEKSYEEEIAENDAGLAFTEILERSKKLEAHFINGSEGKAYYSDLNFDLLGRIAEQASGATLENLYDKYIIKPLSLKSTHLSRLDSTFTPVYMGEEKAFRPLYLTSARASGGMISTAPELMKFLKAFFNGELFAKSNIASVEWNKIQFFPLEYGKGMMRVKMPRIMSPFMPAPEIIGHSGSSGSYAFYCPSKQVYIVGTLNQTEKNPFQTIYMMLNCVE